MRFKTLALCSASAALLGLAAAPAWAQTDPAPLPPGPADAPVEPTDAGDNAAAQQQDDVGAVDDAEDAEVEELVVTGLRRSLRSAQNIKRQSDAIVDAVVAEDIGKLPDVTASESLARVTGVQVTRAAGEAADVTIRGLPNVTTTYNGREIFTAEGRQVAIQDFPAGTVQALEVFKSGTADQVEAGIAGLVNVRSRRPFDFAGREVSGSLNAVHFEQSGKNAWNGNLLLSDRWETGAGDMGVLLNVAYTSLRFLDSTREQSLDIDTSTPAQSPEPPFRFPSSTQMYLGEGRRWRPSANLAFQWRPNDEWQLYADALYQGYRGRDGDVWNWNPLFGGSTFTNVVLRPGTNVAQSATVQQPFRSDGYKAALNRDTDTWQIGAGGVFTRGDLKLSADIARTESTVTDDQANLDYAYRGPTTVLAVFDLQSGDGGPSFSLPNYNTQDPANIIYRGLFERRQLSEGEDWQVRGDADYQVDFGPITSLQAGLRYVDHDASRLDGNRYSPGEHLGINLGQLSLKTETLLGFAFDDDFGFPGVVLPTRDSIHENIDRLREIAGFAPGDVPYNARPSLEANENSLAGYLQARYAFEGPLPIDGVIGVRGVRTETTVAGVQTNIPPDPDGPEGPLPAPPTTITEITRSTEFTDWLPNVSTRLHFTDDLQLRLAYTKTRTRPNFDDLNPTFTIFPDIIAVDPETDLPVRGASGGSVELNPYTSNNYDASLEWYFSNTGSATAAVFRREVEGFIERETIRIPDPTDPDFLIDFNRPFNRGTNNLSGYELSLITFFDFGSLPEWAHNFGVQANYTHLEDDGDQKLQNLSENAFNVIGIWETSFASARLSYNYRSEYIEFYAGNSGVNNPVMTDDRGHLDFSASYTPIENVTFAFDALNITGEPLKRDRVFNAAGDSYPWNRKYLERVYSLGVRFRF